MVGSCQNPDAGTATGTAGTTVISVSRGGATADAHAGPRGDPSAALLAARTSALAAPPRVLSFLITTALYVHIYYSTRAQYASAISCAVAPIFCVLTSQFSLRLYSESTEGCDKLSAFRAPPFAAVQPSPRSPRCCAKNPKRALAQFPFAETLQYLLYSFGTAQSYIHHSALLTS